MKTTDIGYINKNNQKNLGYRGMSETHYNQKSFEMECLECGHKYLTNGCDVWLRKCPACENGKSRNNCKDKKVNINSNMTEPEVSLRIAMFYIEGRKTFEDVIVSIDGAHVKINETVYFNVEEFLLENGYIKCENSDKWQGKYRNEQHLPAIIVTSRSGIGDVLVNLNDGRSLYIESKKFKKQGGGEYSAMHEAIGQLITGCPDDKIPVVAVPYNEKSMELAKRWSIKSRICNAGIRFVLVHEDGVYEQ